MLVCAPQTLSSGTAKSWSEVFWIQLNYWTTWAILSPGIFWLCAWLYQGPHTWQRYVPAMLLGITAVSVFHPLIENSFIFAEGWAKWLLGIATEHPRDFSSKVWFSIIKATGTNPFMFAVITLVWHALRS